MAKVYPSTNVTINSEHELVISAVDKKIRVKTKLPFYMIGKKHHNDTRRKSMREGYPLLDVILEFTAPEKWLFKKLIARLDDSLLIKIVSKDLSKADQNRKAKAAQGLIKKGLIKKVKQEYYMLNPAAFIFSKTEEENIIKWDGLK